MGERDGTVTVLATGGTIASLPGPEGGVVAAASGEELLAAVPELAQVADCRVEELFRIGGYLMTPREMLVVAQRVRELEAERGVSGIVVTHGTDTMEETAYLVDLLYAGEKPVVFTGAQRNAAVPDTDGPRNLRDAVRVAASPAARGLGAVIVMGGVVEAAREATKVHTSDLRAFGSPGAGSLGEVTEEAVHVFRSRPRPGNLSRVDALPYRVSLVKLFAGIDGTFIRAAREAGDGGIVLECFGIGNANRAVLSEVERCIESGMAVLVVSRCPEGRVRPVYGNGGGHDLAAAGAIFGGSLSGQKARVLLMAALAAAGESGGAVEELLAPHLAL
ncbi:asparaginase [Rubrobacter taiwanensis]|jgi:L-asparaginase|uniref:asparaginase n=1 Tax=Rubrobacter taiwanensis TaxID=185139 RepID=A0A4R1BKZ3_9ACTN|nr:asparaginase [Rubrobacter taiwanensis]TCJ18095.1 asparaginase [Rubrobacter taiwanensis]